MAELPKGFKCKCGKFHRFHVWVYAHWRELLDFTCDECGQKYTVVMGHAKAEGNAARKSQCGSK